MSRPARAGVRGFVLALLVVAMLMLAGCGGDEPATGSTGATGGSSNGEVTVEELGAGEQRAGLAVDVKGPLQVSFRRITIPPGAGTGRHCHAGNLIAVVEQGALTHHAKNHRGGVRVYRQGESILEGSGYIHEGMNEGDEDVVLLVTYLTPKGSPPAETNLRRCD